MVLGKEVFAFCFPTGLEVSEAVSGAGVMLALLLLPSASRSWMGDAPCPFPPMSPKLCSQFGAEMLHAEQSGLSPSNTKVWSVPCWLKEKAAHHQLLRLIQAVSPRATSPSCSSRPAGGCRTSFPPCAISAGHTAALTAR